ncbi:MAG: tRNA lysidine(34) synthetase TilS [Clostridia bacterium]|nr:tRNA lysidine(34) synthetase TilS [Clostridia bacterium]
MLCGERGVLAGYSGGADSSALLHILKRICDERGIYLHAMHIHHGIRGAEADRDAELCVRECERMGVDITVERADIPRLARESGCGLEETARAYRYAAFVRKVTSDERISCVATAHNADDNAETVIFNLTRGSGIDGLRGIPPVREEAGVRIIRPLICASKCDIVGYCEQNGIEYIFDSTNDDTVYTRNYIRHEIMPRLRELNPSFVVAAERLSSNLRSDSEYLEAEAERFYKENVRDGKIGAAVLASAHRAIAVRVIAKLFSTVSLRTLERVHIDTVCELAKNSADGSSVSLIGGVRAKCERGELFFTAVPDAAPYEFCRELHYGANSFENPDFAIFMAKDGEVSTDLQKDNETLQNIYKLSILTQVNSDKINHVLFARSRREGDSYVFGGMTRKIKKLYNDRKLPLKRRGEIPIVCDGEGIVWVPGFSTADRVKSDGSGLRLIYYYNGEENE